MIETIPTIRHRIPFDLSNICFVPVLSAHKTFIDAASSTAVRRVGRTPSLASERAPSAAARVKVAGSATGIDARTAVKTRGRISASGILRNHA